MTPQELLNIKLTPNSGGDYFRVRTSKTSTGGAKTIYFRAMSISKDGTFLCGFEIDKDTLDEKGCYFDKDKKTGREVHHVQKHMIHCACITKMTPLFNDMKYGGLTTLDIPDQRKKYGY